MYLRFIGEFLNLLFRTVVTLEVLATVAVAFGLYLFWRLVKAYERSVAKNHKE